MEEGDAFVDPKSDTEPQRVNALVLQAGEDLLLVVSLLRLLERLDLGLHRFRVHAVFFSSHEEGCLIQVSCNISVFTESIVKEIGVLLTDL
jgi:hypothetical protein